MCIRDSAAIGRALLSEHDLAQRERARRGGAAALTVAGVSTGTSIQPSGMASVKAISDTAEFTRKLLKMAPPSQMAGREIPQRLLSHVVGCQQSA